MAAEFSNDGRMTVVTAFELWAYNDDRQRVLWPSTIRLNSDYFESLQNHAVPLDERALGALAHSALALDIYQIAPQCSAYNREAV